MQRALSTTSLLTGFSFGQERLKEFLDLILDMQQKRLGPDANWISREGKYAPEESRAR